MIDAFNNVCIRRLHQSSAIVSVNLFLVVNERIPDSPVCHWTNKSVVKDMNPGISSQGKRSDHPIKSIYDLVGGYS